MSSRLVSEPDFVANQLLPKFKEAAEALNLKGVLDFHVEKAINSGRADLVAERGGRGLIVLEAKYKKRIGRIERLIEPRDPEVVKQAVEYANVGGYPNYCTCNPRRLVMFKVIPGKKTFESEVASFEFEKNPKWAEDILKIALEMVPVRAKAIDDSLVSSLQEAFADLYGEFLASLRERLKEGDFKARFEEWLRDQGLEFNDENVRKVAEQTTYLQINKLLFYNVVRTIYPGKLTQVEVGETEDLFDALSKYYEDVKTIDYLPIYQSDLMSEIKFTKRAKERFRTLIDTLKEYDFSMMESDFLGRVYEKLIPPVDRKRLGQFYTPPEIVDLIIKLTVRDKNAKVLDPACGSGSFLVKAYHQLRELNGVPRDISGPLAETFHKQLLDQVYGIDINQFPAHLSVINLAVQNPRAKVDRVSVIVKDFFDIRPRQETLTGFDSMTAEGDKTLVKMPYSFDAVVANPPYIRQELLGNAEKEKIFELIEKEYKDELFVGKAKKPRALILDRMSDIYVYFYIHSIKFLKNGGMLGYISSNKWLEVGYGEPFQEFLLKNTEVMYVIEFDRAVFPDAEVNTSVVILKKENDLNKRRENLVRFVRIKKPIDQAELLGLLESNEDLEDEKIRITIVRQKRLKPGKWNVYLRAPLVFKKIMNHPKMKPLYETVEVIRGPTTGCNDFFILSKEKAQKDGIEPEFLIPCISSPKKVRGLIVRPEDVDEYFFMCDKPKENLRGTNALKYVEKGEKLEVEVTRGSKKGRIKLPQLETLKSRKLWYALPKPKIPSILFPRLVDVNARFLKNEARSLGPHVFYLIYPKKSDYELLAYLNSSLVAFLIELKGRSYGGGVLELLIYEAQELPAIDFEKTSEVERKKLGEALNSLLKSVDKRVEAEEALELVQSSKKKQVGLLELDALKKLDEAIKAEKATQQKLDEAVYDILNLTKEEMRQVEEGLRELQEMRRARTRL